MLNNMPFRARLAYWKADDGRVFSGTTEMQTDETDQGYIDFVNGGGRVTLWPRDDAGNQTDASLQVVLDQWGMFANLTYYTADVTVKKATSNITVNGLPFATDPVTMMSLNAAYIYTISKQSNAFSWKLPDGSFITLNTAQITALQSCVAGYGQSCYTCEDNTLTAMEAGTITTRAQVDAAFAAIVTVFTGLALDTQTRHGPRARGAKGQR